MIINFHDLARQPTGPELCGLAERVANRPPYRSQGWPIYPDMEMVREEIAEAEAARAYVRELHRWSDELNRRATFLCDEARKIGCGPSGWVADAPPEGARLWAQAKRDSAFAEAATRVRVAIIRHWSGTPGFDDEGSEA